MQPEFVQPSWPFFDNKTLDEDKKYIYDTDSHLGHSEFSSPFTTIEDSSDIFVIPNFPTMYSDELTDFPVHADELDIMLPKDDFSLDLEEFELMLRGEVGDMIGSLEESEGISPSLQQLPIDGEDEWSLSQSMKSSQTLTVPTEDTEIDNPLGVIHLVKAYGEAMEKEQKQLAEVIVKYISEKVSPVGEIMDRLLYYLFHPSDKQTDYLKQESGKNFHAAFKAFYQIFPYGKFAHFAANLAILEAMPRDVEVIRIIDFDVGEGTQWPSVIEAIGCQQREIRLTSIKWIEADSHCDTSRWRFDERQRLLCDHAKSFGLKLKMEEMELCDFAYEIKKIKKCGRREWFAFNCMVGLPHMGSVRSRRHVMEFLKVAKQLLVLTPNCETRNKGIITIGDGDALEVIKNSSTFGSFFDGYLVHYQALLESMECSFPIHLGEARTAMECLFVAPFVSSLAWIQKWKERKEFCGFQSSTVLEGWKVSKKSLMEAKEMVREGESLYRVRVEGDNKNEMVLEWRGTPLVRVSLWRS